MNCLLTAFCCVLLSLHVLAAPANQFTYLENNDPFYVGRDFPKLATPQWIGEEGVDAVIVLSIDDMRHNEPKYESILRPIIERLKKIDGRAPVSIFVNTTSPTNAQLQSWLSGGVSLECHTIAHPCPLCQRNDFGAASATYHDCVDLLSSIPRNRPVAFRMPCCDSMNSPTPRFYAEIFNRSSAGGKFLTIDSSVMVLLTTNDASLPRDLVMDSSGQERFRKYLPTATNASTRVSMGSFTTTIEDYPYPYVIGKVAWQFPCIVPSDWEAHNLHGSTNDVTVDDWKRALDAVVIKQGVMTIVFHPHGWIRPDQVAAFVDYASSRYGRRIKFLTFPESEQRLNKHLLAGAPIRAVDGGDNGVRLVDLNHDGFLDVISAPSSGDRRTRIWNPFARTWTETSFPVSLAGHVSRLGRASIGVLASNEPPVAIVASSNQVAAWTFRANQWQRHAGEFTSLPAFDRAGETISLTNATAFHFRDVDRDGGSELIVWIGGLSAIYKRDRVKDVWRKLPYALPDGVTLVDKDGADAGLRFVDVDADGFDDVIFSNHERYSLHLFRIDDRKLRLKPGWTDEVLAGKRIDPLQDPIPPIVRAGTTRNNGVWFSRRTMWIQNENTAHLPDKVDRRPFDKMLTGYAPPPLDPESALKTIQVHPGFEVQLVAAEPEIADPVSFEWSADGRLWVVEMGDYPMGIDGSGKAGGRIRVLEDSDGDGRYETAGTFLDNLNFPTGAYPWRKGVVVSAAPDIFYAEDTDGDGKADLREVLYTGFVEGNQQHRVNGFDYGLDGWLYVANGDSGGAIRANGVGASSTAVNIRGHDLRVQPDKRLIESIAGQTQYGLRRDDWGNWFGNNNPTWLWHYFFPQHYLTRNPLLPVRSLKKILANYPNSTRCFPISRTLSRFNDPFAFNHVTSASGPAANRDDLFGQGFDGAVFICESVHNLVHCEILKADGVSFSSARHSAEPNSEFMASTDNWFRPVSARTGPDGALYVADMYRYVIEHPEWIPAEMQRRLDLRAGSDKGRIYRVAPKRAPRRKVPDLTVLNTPELVAAMDSSNGWQRDTAQRLMVERGDSSVVPALEALVQSAPSAKVRVQALWTLSAIGSLSAETIHIGLRDRHARVREHAVRLSEPLLTRDAASPLLEKVLVLARDSDPRVRFQVAFTLGECRDSRAGEALAHLAADPDVNIQNAALSGAALHAGALLERFSRMSKPNSAHVKMLATIEKEGIRSTAAPSFIQRTNVVSSEQRAARAKAVERYKEVSALKPDLDSGRALFEQHCAQCHRHRGVGAQVGPDLGIMTGKPIDQLVVAIVDPNAAVEERFRAVSVTPVDGEELTGVLVSETPTSITLRMPNQEDAVLLRRNLKEVSVSGMSLMPEELDAALTPQQMADLGAFVLGQ